MLAALEGEADDCSATEGGFEVIADPTAFARVAEALEAGGFRPEKSEIAALPKTTVIVDDADKVALLVRLLGTLDELDDVQSTACNLEWTPAALAAAEQA